MSDLVDVFVGLNDLSKAIRDSEYLKTFLDWLDKADRWLPTLVVWDGSELVCSRTYSAHEKGVEIFGSAGGDVSLRFDAQGSVLEIEGSLKCFALGFKNVAVRNGAQVVAANCLDVVAEEGGELFAYGCYNACARKQGRLTTISK